MKKYADIGEIVKIIIPNLFERCGYTLNRGVLMKNRKEEMEKLILQAYNSLEFTKLPPGIAISKGLSNIDIIPYFVRDKFEQAVCAAVVQNECFGGKERKVFEIEEPKIKDKFAIVTAKKYVRTGKYYHGYYDNLDEDYEPPGLEDAKTECIYTLNLNLSDSVSTSHWLISPPEFLYIDCSDPIQVLATNCQRECD